MSISNVNFGATAFKQLNERDLNKRREIHFGNSKPEDVLSWKENVEKKPLTIDFLIKPITPALKKLFNAVPKTELHLHLSGSTPLKTIRDIMRQNGVPEEKIMEDTNISPNFHGLDDFLKTYYKVAWVVKTPEHFKKAAYQICMDAADENVKYLEIRTSAIGKEGKPEEIIQAVEDGIKAAQKDLKTNGFDQKAKIIVLMQRHHSETEAMEHVKLAESLANKPGSLVVGVDLAGPEAGFPITFFEKPIKYAKNAGLKVTLHAGETRGSNYQPNEKLSPIFGEQPVVLSGAQSIQKAVEYGADRLGHAVHLYDDPKVALEVINKGIAVESPPKCNVQLESVNAYETHPIKRMLDDGVMVSLSTDNRTISGTDLDNEIEQLYKHRVLTDWNDLKKLIINGAKSVFLPEAEKQQLVQDFTTELKQIETTPEYKTVIDKYLTPAKKAVAFAGTKLKQALANQKAA